MRRNKTPFWFYPVFSLGPWLWPKFSPWNGNSTLQFPLGPWDRWPKQGLHVSLLFEGTSRANSRGEQVEQHRRRSLNFDLEPERHGPMGRRRNGVEKHFVSGSKSIFFLVKTYKTRVHKVNWSKNPRILCEFDNEQTFSIKKPKSAFHSGPFLWVGGVSGWGGGIFFEKQRKTERLLRLEERKEKGRDSRGKWSESVNLSTLFFRFSSPFFFDYSPPFLLLLRRRFWISSSVFFTPIPSDFFEIWLFFFRHSLGADAVRCRKKNAHSEGEHEGRGPKRAASEERPIQSQNKRRPPKTFVGRSRPVSTFQGQHLGKQQQNAPKGYSKGNTKGDIKGVFQLTRRKRKSKATAKRWPWRP